MNARSEEQSSPVAPLGYLAPLCVAIFFIFIWVIVGARHRQIRRADGTHTIDPESLVMRGVIPRSEVEKQFPLVTYCTWWMNRNTHEAAAKEIDRRPSTGSNDSITYCKDGRDGDQVGKEIPSTTAKGDGQDVQTHSDGNGETTSGLRSEEEPKDTASSNTGDSYLCAICMEGFDEGDLIRPLTCGHIFHPACVDPWLTKRQACCPLCKTTFFRGPSSQSTESDRYRLRFATLMPTVPGAALIRTDVFPRSP